MPAPKRPKRRWRVLAIAMAACAVLLAVAWLASTRYTFGRFHPLFMGACLKPVAMNGMLIYQEQACPPGTSARWATVSGRGEPMRWLPARIALVPGVTLLILPLWIPTAASALAALAFWRIDAAHRRRLRTGLCAACGYDRAGLPAGAACPECGAATAPPFAVSR